MRIAYVSLIVAIIGLLMFVTTKTNAEVKRVGEIMFFCGVFIFLATLTTLVIRL